jgi:aspartate kinase
MKLARERINQNMSIDIQEEISREKTQTGIMQFLEQGIIPVVCGFLALSEEGELLTLGRGGSDTSAFLLGKLVNASEVIIVTDVKGLLKADPERVKSPESVNYISVDEIDIVTRSGGQVLHPQSLEYKTDRMKARIVHFAEDDYLDTGTEIIGFYKARLKGIQKKLALVTLVGENLSENQALWKEIGQLLSELKSPLFGLSFTEGFIGFYIDDDKADEFYTQLNEFSKNKHYIKNIIQRKGITRLNLSSHDNAESPALLSEIFELLTERGINVIEVITNHSDISVFVDWGARREAGKIFKRLATDINLREVLDE